jgi:hypothetical protein
VTQRETSYAWNEGTALAYQIASTSSAGPDLLFAPGSVTHLEVLWQEPRVERFLTRVAASIATGTGFVFEDAGEHELKGIPERWHLYRVVSR